MVLSGVLSIALGVILLLDRSYSFLILGSFVKFLAFGMILCGILLLGFTWWSSHQIRVCSVFVEASTRFLGQSLLTLSYIPLFVVLSVVFVGVITFQYLSFGSSKFIHINPNDIYWNGSSATLWNLFNLVEFLWGIFILRDSCNQPLIQSTLLSQAMLWSGTSHKQQPAAWDPSPDYSPRTWAAWLWGRSSIAPSRSLNSCLIC